MVSENAIDIREGLALGREMISELKIYADENLEILRELLNNDELMDAFGDEITALAENAEQIYKLL